VKPVALDLDGVLGDTRPLWRDWLEDVARRSRVDLSALPEDRAAAAGELDRLVGNWRALLAHFAEDRAPVYLRPSSEVSGALRRLAGEGVRLGAFTDAPRELAEVAASQLGASRRLEALEAGADALEGLLARLGRDARVVRDRAGLLGL
jgi:phosphoglycolate phosphatase-like HAD superfamily hydrolase